MIRTAQDYEGRIDELEANIMDLEERLDVTKCKARSEMAVLRSENHLAWKDGKVLSHRDQADLRQENSDLRTEISRLRDNYSESLDRYRTENNHLREENRTLKEKAVTRREGWQTIASKDREIERLRELNLKICDDWEEESCRLKAELRKVRRDSDAKLDAYRLSQAKNKRLRDEAKSLRADRWAANVETKQHDKELYDLRVLLAKSVELSILERSCIIRMCDGEWNPGDHHMRRALVAKVTTI